MHLNILYYFGLLFLLAGCAQTPFNTNHLAPDKALMLYVEISTPFASSFLGKVGSGTIVKDGILVTNKHVTDTLFPQNAHFINGQKIRLTDAILSKRLDIAFYLIPCEYQGVDNLPVSERIIDEVFSLGSSLGLSNNKSLIEGRIVYSDFFMHHTDVELESPIDRDKNGQAISRGFLYDAQGLEGFSGGPVYNRKAQLIGINQGRSTQILDGRQGDNIENYAFAYYLQDILTELEALIPNSKSHCKKPQDKYLAD